MVDNVSFSVTNKCNCKCKICNIWKTTDFSDEMSVTEIKKLFAEPCFKNIDTISLTGGEPFLRNDLSDIIIVLKNTLPKLNRVFLNTNASLPDRIVPVCKLCSELFDTTILSVSLDGRPIIHNTLRGVNIYDRVIGLLSKTKNIPGLGLSISMTLSQSNSSKADLMHAYQIANANKAGFSFRFADNSSTYYKNTALNLSVSPQQKQIVSKFIADNCTDNEFLLCLKSFIDTGKLELLVDGQKNKCLAGRTFVFIHPNGTISPCLYSTQTLTPSQLLAKQNIKLGKQEPCPCCTDCAIYPILEHIQKTK